MDVKVNALVLRAADYNENDKILTLFTAEYGKISAGIKGVKKAGAKLRFAAQPFCFAEYILSRKGERYTVTGASECESFYELRTDINKFYAACAALEAAGALTFDGAENAVIFSELLKTLSAMCTGNEAEALLRFLSLALKFSGYGYSAGDCAVCGASLKDAQKLCFDFRSGGFTCASCGGAGARYSTYLAMRAALGGSVFPPAASGEGVARALKLLREYFSVKANITLRSLEEYLRLP